MKIKMSQLVLVLLLSSILTLTQCGSGGGSDGSSGGAEDSVTAANVLGTWTASSGNVEDIRSFTVSEVEGWDDRVTILVNYGDTSTDTGVVFYTETDTSGARSVTIELSAGTLTGTISLASDCQTMTVVIEGESGTFSNTGNTCTDI